MIVRKKITILGIVSGKTFSLYVFSLANKFNIAGWVKRGIGFVDIEAEGLDSNIIEFICIIHDLSKQLTKSVEIRFSDICLLGTYEFHIIESDDRSFSSALALTDNFSNV